MFMCISLKPEDECNLWPSFFVEDDNMESISAKCIMIWILDGGKKDWMICMKRVSLSSTFKETRVSLCKKYTQPQI